MSQPLPGSTKFLIGLGIFVLLVAALGVLIHVSTEAYVEFGKGPGFDWRWGALTLIPFAFIIFLIATVTYARKYGTMANWRFAGYQVVTFLILGLSLLAFALHHKGEAGRPQPAPTQQPSGQQNNVNESQTPAEAIPSTLTMDTPRNISEMAAIMILFLLAELAAFVAHDVTEAKRMLKELGDTTQEAVDKTKGAAKEIGDNLESLEEATQNIGQLRLVASIATLHPQVLNETVSLVRAWAKRVPSIREGHGREPEMQDVSDLCWRILLQKYFQEELADFQPQRIDQGIPLSVRPVYGYQQKDVSFLATNIGFYARFLSSMVDYLVAEKEEDQKLCMAIVTNALPAHCWNWPMSDESWRSYEPIDRYRNSMIAAVKKGAQIDRILLVSCLQGGAVREADQSDRPQTPDSPLFTRYRGLWRQGLLKEMREQWYILASVEKEGEDKEKILCSEDFATTHGGLGTNALPLFPLPIGCAAKKTFGKVYPVISTTSLPPQSFIDEIKHEWQAQKLFDLYNDSLHGQDGGCWQLPLDDVGLNIFDERHDIMFIGLGKGNRGEKGLWTDFNDCNWGICLMSSMNVTTETMFLTVVSGASVRTHYDWCRDILIHKLIWQDNRLNSKPAAGTPNPGVVV
ncbi:MAG: hypothetical protein AABN34_22080 [Acidobacteriota bacterium]